MVDIRKFTRFFADLLEAIVFGVVIAILVFAVVLGFLLLLKALPAPSEKITRFEIVFDGQVVQCKRREDRARGTRTTAC